MRPHSSCSAQAGTVTKEPEMPQTDAFCKHTMQQNATAAGLRPEQHTASKRGRFVSSRGGNREEGGEGQKGRGSRLMTLILSCCQTT